MNTTYTHTKYTDKAKSTKENIAGKKRKRRAPAARNLQARVALLSPLDARDKLTLIETFRLDFLGIVRNTVVDAAKRRNSALFLYEETFISNSFFFLCRPRQKTGKKKGKLSARL